MKGYLKLSRESVLWELKAQCLVAHTNFNTNLEEQEDMCGGVANDAGPISARLDIIEVR